MTCKSFLFTLCAISLSVLTTACNSSSGSNASSTLSASLSANSIVRSSSVGESNTICMKDTVSIVSLSGAINVNGAETITGDVVALDNSSVQIGSSVHIFGSVYLDLGASAHDSASEAVTGGVLQKDISNDQVLLTDFMTSLTSLNPTQSFDTISLTTTGPRPGPWTAEPNLCVGAERSPVFVS